MQVLLGCLSHQSKYLISLLGITQTCHRTVVLHSEEQLATTRVGQRCDLLSNRIRVEPVSRLDCGFELPRGILSLRDALL